MIDAGGLAADEAVIAASGASNIDVLVTEDLTIAATGGSQIRYSCAECGAAS